MSHNGSIRTQILKTLRRPALGMLSAATLLTVLSACTMMQSDRSNCPTCTNALRVRLDYLTHSVHEADQGQVTPHGVNDAVCYLLDTDGHVLQSVGAHADPQLKNPDYAFVFDELPPADYDLLCVSAQQPLDGAVPNWPTLVRLDEGDDVSRLEFQVPFAPIPLEGGYYEVDHSRALDSVYLSMSKSIGGQSVAAITLEQNKPLTVQAEQMRLTNNLNLVLVQLENPADHDASHYDVRVLDHNGHLDHRAEPLDQRPLLYRPFAAWTTETVETDPAAAHTRAPGDVVSRTAHYDLSLCRLFTHTSSADNARLQVVNRSDGQVAIDLDLIHLLLLLRNSYELNTDPQRFLDIHDDFRISVVLQGNQWKYMDISINVLGWAMRIQNEVL